MAKKKAAVKKKSPKKKAVKKKAVSKKAEPFKGGKKKGGSVYDRERQKRERTSSGSSSKFWSFPKDWTEAVIRVLAFINKATGEEEITQYVATHWLPKELKMLEVRKVSCLYDRDGNCPLCDLEEDLSDPEWSKIKPARRKWVNAVIREGGEQGEDIFRVADLTLGGVKNLMHVLLDGDLSDPLNIKRGHDVKMEKTGKGMETRYPCLPMHRRTAVGMKVVAYDLVDMHLQTMKDVDSVAAIANAVRENI